MRPPRFAWSTRRTATLAVAVLAGLLLTGCEEAARLAEISPRLIAPGAGSHTGLAQPPAPAPATADLPPEQTNPAFEFAPANRDEQGRQVYKVRIGPGGNPYLVATEKLTPLFLADGEDAATYVSHAYFRAHPDRTPASIQPGDEFLLALPADAFLVRWQEDRQENFGHPARLREYVSERGDRLRYYLTEPFPIRYELESAATPGHGVVHFDPDLAFLLKTGLTEPVRLAQLVYRVPDPDIFQVEAMRRLAANARSGVETTLEIDHTTPYLDLVRAALPKAIHTEPVSDPDRAYLQRAAFAPDAGVPFLAVEDALGRRTDLAAVANGRVFRIEYQWDGTVRVYYKTGPDDALGKRDPYQFRENERWAAIYERLAPDADAPIKWGPGEPADLEPFPTARDPDQHNPQSYDYLVPGRALVLTFRPTRYQADLRAQAEFSELLRDARERYRSEIDGTLRALDRVQRSDAAARP
jgi:hypothetical protein